MRASLLRGLPFASASFFLLFLASAALAQQPSSPAAPAVAGFHNFGVEQQVENRFLAVPDAKLAEEHLRILTAEPHIAGSPEEQKTADYVAQKFRHAGFDLEVAP